MRIGVKILHTAFVEWANLKFIQHETFKDLSLSDKMRLKSSIVSNQFIQPFFVWECPTEGIYCLDGKHRIDILNELVKDGYDVPQLLPATFIDCLNKQEASKLVLLYSSQYAHISTEGFKEFINNYELDLPNLLNEISILGLDHFEPLPLPSNFEREAKDKAPTIKITFASPDDLEKAKSEIENIINKYPKSFYSVSCGEI